MILRPPRQASVGRSALHSPDARQVYEVESIVDSKQRKGKTFYLVKWKRYSDADNTWEPRENLQESGVCCPVQRCS